MPSPEAAPLIQEADLRVPIGRGPLLRFPTAVEYRYRTWEQLEARPLFLITGGLSVLVWLVIPLASIVADATPRPGLLFLIAYGINIPVLVLSGALMVGTRPQHVTVLGATTLVIIGASAMFGLDRAYPDAMPAVASTAVIWYALLAPFMRIPFVGTCVVTAINVALGTYLFARAATEQDLATSAVFAHLAFIASATVMIPGLALIAERTMRRRFAAEETVRLQQELLRRYAPTGVVNRIRQGDGAIASAQRRRVTVFSSDIVGFTQLADRLDPEALAEVINDYVASLADLIDSHGGTVTEFAGDGMMAIFGAPEDQEPYDQVRGALASAQEFHASLATWSERWYPLGITEPLTARVGINTGMVSVGTFGSSVRATYTGIGLQMNIAARIQAHADPGFTLLSSTSWHLIKDEVECHPHGEVMVKGVHFPIEMYQPR